MGQNARVDGGGITEEQVGEATILNTQGFHARPVMRFVDMASTFSSQIIVEKAKGPTDRVDGKSPMQLMLLCATKGTSLRITARGSDAHKAVEELVALVHRRFDQGDHA